MSEHHCEEGSHNGVQRKGKPEKEVEEKAARVTKVKACWTCWLLRFR